MGIWGEGVTGNPPLKLMIFIALVFCVHTGQQQAHFGQVSQARKWVWSNIIMGVAS